MQYFSGHSNNLLHFISPHVSSDPMTHPIMKLLCGNTFMCSPHSFNYGIVENKGVTTSLYVAGPNYFNLGQSISLVKTDCGE